MQQVSEVNNFIEAIDTKFFKIFSEPVRLEILKTLMTGGKMDIKSISEHLPQDRSVISRHLQIMQDSHIVSATKESRHMYYAVNAEFLISAFSRINELASCCKNCC
jgi:DNA-binding transcriptional ArsR family regulator